MAATRVLRDTWQGRPAWRKTYSDGGHRRRVAALRWFARKLGADPLLAPVPLSPELACRTEQAMIRRLAALGARVPPLLAVEQRSLLLGDLGPTLALVCRAEPSPSRREALVRLGQEAIIGLHARDILFYAHSTARFLADSPGRHVALLQAQLARAEPAVRAEVARTARRLRWLVLLARPWGGRSREVAEALQSLARATA